MDTQTSESYDSLFRRVRDSFESIEKRWSDNTQNWGFLDFEGKTYFFQVEWDNKGIKCTFKTLREVDPNKLPDFFDRS